MPPANNTRTRKRTIPEPPLPTPPHSTTTVNTSPSEREPPIVTAQHPADDRNLTFEMTTDQYKNLLILVLLGIMLSFLAAAIHQAGYEKGVRDCRFRKRAK
ncbi:hypothetical protein AC578_4125 [Pseudocercospora eumusae]|uniref:Uncharacterized protein n=1 Tax=Pseudocercospora eumusae TaxID=321146 RepID=A0A139HFB8_9PEZI|nr:hypothetical protein AC578_4125 [Pseudocercospora eumusae]